MLARGVEPMPATYNAAVCALARLGRLDDALALLDAAAAKGVERGVTTYAALLAACEARGRWAAALDLLRRMQEDGLKPTTTCLNAAIGACVSGGEPARAEALFEALAGAGACKPDAATLNALARVYCQLGKAREALGAADAMLRGAQHVEAPTYAALVQALWATGALPLQAYAVRLHERAVARHALPAAGADDDAAAGATRLALPAAPAYASLLALVQLLRALQARLAGAGCAAAAAALRPVVLLEVHSLPDDQILTEQVVLGVLCALGCPLQPLPRLPAVGGGGLELAAGAMGAASAPLPAAAEPAPSAAVLMASGIHFGALDDDGAAGAGAGGAFAAPPQAPSSRASPVSAPLPSIAEGAAAVELAPAPAPANGRDDGSGGSGSPGGVPAFGTVAAADAPAPSPPGAAGSPQPQASPQPSPPSPPLPLQLACDGLAFAAWMANPAVGAALAALLPPPSAAAAPPLSPAQAPCGFEPSLAAAGGAPGQLPDGQALARADLECEARCQVAMAAVQRIEAACGVDAGALPGAYLLQRPELAGLLVGAAPLLGLAPEAGHDAALLLDRAAAARAPLDWADPGAARLAAAACLALCAPQGAAVDGGALEALFGAPPPAVAAAAAGVRAALGGSVAAVSAARVLRLYAERLGSPGGRAAAAAGAPPAAAALGRALDAAAAAAASPALLGVPPSAAAMALAFAGRLAAGLFPAWPEALRALTGYECGADDAALAPLVRGALELVLLAE